MSVESQTGHYFWEDQFPSSPIQWTTYGLATIVSNLANPVQVIFDMTFDGGGHAVAYYHNAGDGNMYVVSLIDGVPIVGGATVFPSRPTLGSRFEWFLKTDGVTLTAGYNHDIGNPAGWVIESCNALDADQAMVIFAISITSNSNPLHSRFDAVRMTDLLLTPSQISADLLNSTSAIIDPLNAVGDFLLPNVAGVVEQSGSAATLTPQSGGLTDGPEYVFPGSGGGGAGELRCSLSLLMSGLI